MKNRISYLLLSAGLLLVTCKTEELPVVNGTPDTKPPVVTLAANSPVNFTTAGQLELTATASDSSGIDKIEIYEGTTLVGSGTSAVYEFTKNITKDNNGTYNYTAKAYDKADPGNSSVSTPIQVKVNIPGPGETTPPTVSLTASSTLFTTAGQLKLSAAASDASGIKKIEIYQGATLLGSGTSSPYVFTKNITDANNGTHSFTAKAIDNKDNTKTTAAVVVQVNIDNSGSGTSAGCGKGNSGSQTGIFQIKDGNNTNRQVEIATSSAYNKNQSAPIVIVLHGNGGNIDVSRSFGFMDAINAAGDAGIVVIPQGIDWNGWGIGWNESKNGYDMPLFDNILTYVANNYCADLSRVFVTGFSWGGDMTVALSCFRGDKIRSVANFSGGEVYNRASTCTSTNYPAVRFRYGYVLGDGGDGAYSLANFQGVTTYFRTVLGASTTTTPVSPSPCVEYTGGAEPMIVCADSNMGHSQPSLNEAKQTWAFWKSLP